MLHHRRARSPSAPIRSCSAATASARGVALPLLLVLASAQAQQADAGAAAQGATSLAPVVVQAQRSDQGYVAAQASAGTKTDTPLLEVPQSISVIGADQISEQGAQTIAAAMRFVPGVQAEQYGGADLRIDRYMLRGFSDTMPYLDGLATTGRYTLLSNDVEPYGLERIEVLRGPSSVLYGQSAPGGLLSLISKRPSAAPLHEFELQGGSYDRVQGAFDLGGPLDNGGSLLYRVTGLARDTGTQVDRVDDRRYFLAPALSWKPDGDTSLTILSHVQRQQDGYLAQQLPAAGTLDAAPFGRIPTSLFVGEPGLNRWNRTEWSLGYAFEHRFDDTWSIRQNLRYGQGEVNVGYVSGAGLETQADGTPTSILDRYAMAAQAWISNLAIDTQAQARFDTYGIRHTVVFGLDYARSHDRWTEQDGSAAPLDLLNPVYGQPVDLPAPDYATVDTLSQVGLYAQDQMRWRHWGLTAAIRHDWADTNVTNPLPGGGTLPQQDQAFTGKAGLVYLFDNGLAPYASYSSSFQPTQGADANNQPFKPTTGTQYEAGLKYQPRGHDSFLMLSAYSLTQSNRLSNDPANPQLQIQTGAVRVRGLELSAVAALAQGLKLIAAYTHMDPAITSGATQGNQPQDVEHNSASLWLDQTLQGGPLAGLGLGAGVRYTGPRYGDDADTLRIPGDLLVDSTVYYERQGWRLAVNASNLLNRTYVSTCDSNTSCYYGLQRSILGTVSYRW